MNAFTIINVAVKELGTHEKSNGDDKYIKWYGGFALTVAWCAIFVSWCANKAGVATGIIPKFASCDVGMQWFIKKGLFKPNTMYGGKSYVPKAGDIIFFSSKRTMKDSDHVGIVTKCVDGLVHTIEGNTSDQVARRTYTLTSDRILGYGTPVYVSDTPWLSRLQQCVGTAATGKPNASTLSKTRTLKIGCRGEDVYLIQEKLNSLGFNCGTVDGHFGSNTKIAVEAYQHKVVKLKNPDGILDSGKNTWKALIGL